MRNCQYEYIASGLSYAGKFDAPYYVDALPTINGWIKKVDGLHNNRISALYNAYTEDTLAKAQYETFTNFYRHYSDSGGLQMVSLNHGSITDEQKAKIYQIQGEYSDVAMIFDEIPVKVPEHLQKLKPRSEKEKKALKEQNINPGRIMELKNAESRYFDPEAFEPAAKETARNILAQIRHFDAMGSDTKIMCICQGNGADWYQKWLDIILKTVPQDRWERLGGIAFGSPAFGAGIKEDIEKFFLMTQIQAPDHMKKHFHLLGVGALSRITPVIIFRQSGALKPDVLVSYDSTKHTGGLVRGQFQIEHKITSVPRDSKKNLDRFEQNIITFAREVLEVEVAKKWLNDVIFMGMEELETAHVKNKNVRRDIMFMRWIMLLNSIHNFTKAMDRCHTDPDYLKKVCEDQSIMSLKHVQTWDDYRRWDADAGRFLTSARTKSLAEISNLEEFF